MDRRHFLTLAAAGLYGSGCRRRPASTAIRVSAQPYYSMSGLYLAKELGYFENLGLKVEIEKISSSTQAILLAAGGEQDVVFSAASASLVNAIAKGSRLRIVAGREIAAPGCSDNSVFYGRRAAFPSGLNDVRLLKGKRVGADTSVSIGAFSLDTILASGGLKKEDLQILQLRRSELIVALLDERLDAIMASDIALRFQGLRDRIVQGIGLADVAPNHQFSFVIFGSRLLDASLDVGTRFLSAYLHGATDYVAGKTPRFHEELSISNGIDPAAARRDCRNSFVTDGRIDLPSLERFIGWAVAKGLCPIPIRAEQLVDLRYLKALSAERRVQAR
jgi:NitT/TauT family transport system substrate-binding protein